MIGSRIGNGTGLAAGVTIGAETDDAGAPVLVSIEVTAVGGLTFRPTASTDRLQMVATGTYDDMSTADITADVTWTSATETVGTVSNGVGTEGELTAVAGAITGAGEAATVVTATLGAISDDATVTVDTDADATSGWRCPVNAYQWTLLGETIAGIWLCQEASGNLADSAGSLTLTAVVTPTYSNAVAGWTRLAVGCNGTTDGFRAAAGSGPDPSTTSSLWIWYVNIPTAAPGGTAAICYASDTASPHQLGHAATDRIQVKTLAATTNGGVDPGGVRLCMLQYDRANSLANGYTSQEKLVNTYSASVTDGNKGIGIGNNAASLSQYLYGALLSGANAERASGACATLANKLTKTAMSWS